MTEPLSWLGFGTPTFEPIISRYMGPQHGSYIVQYSFIGSEVNGGKWKNSPYLDEHPDIDICQWIKEEATSTH